MESQFSVIRYIADPARYEPINVGVVLQCGETIEVKTNNEAIRRAITSDPQSDAAALGRIDAFVNDLVNQTQLFTDPQSGDLKEVRPPEPDYLSALASVSTGKLAFAHPQKVEIKSYSPNDIDRTVSLLVSRLARPLRRRAGFAPVENAPRQAMHLALRPWIEQGAVKRDFALDSMSGIPRNADFYFENGRNYVVKHSALEHKRESQLFAKAQSDAFALEDIRRGNLDREWQPIVVCQFATDRSEEVVWQVRSIFNVVECTMYDASSEFNDALRFVEDHLPRLLI